MCDARTCMLAVERDPGICRCCARDAAAVNLMRPALEDYQRRLDLMRRMYELYHGTMHTSELADEIFVADYGEAMRDIAAVLTAAGLMEAKDG
jgi:hypothetical protein